MTSAYSINLNFNNTIPVKTDFTFKQGDKGITLNLATTGLDTTGTTAHIVFKRSNGTSVEAELTGQTGPSYSYTILGNEFEIPGVVVADLKLYNGDTQRVSTASFIFLVTSDTMDGVGGGTGGYSDQLEQLSQEFAETLEEYQDAFGDVGAVNPRGEYDALEEYTALDLVSYNGSSYLCREGCTGIVPTNTTYWQVFAAGNASPDAENVNYDNTTSQLTANNVQDAIDETNGRITKKTDLTSIIATGLTNTTGATITAGTYFYLNGTLVKAKADIVASATFTENTNYEVVTAGALNDLSKVKNGTCVVSGSYANLDEPFTVSLSKRNGIVIWSGFVSKAGLTAKTWHNSILSSPIPEDFRPAADFVYRNMSIEGNGYNLRFWTNGQVDLYLSGSSTINHMETQVMWITNT